MWSTRLRYQLVFDTRVTRVEAPRLLEVATEGELIGTGRWQLSQESLSMAD